MKPDTIHEVFCPGRICLFGEHSDWAATYRDDSSSTPVIGSISKGLCLISGTEQGLYARVRVNHSQKLELRCTLHCGDVRTTVIDVKTDEDLLSEATSGSEWSYMCGVVYQLRKSFPHIGGIHLDNYKTTLPVKKGLSSSAAACVLVARAYNVLYDLDLSHRDEMEYAYKGETTTPSKCGRMDQGCAFGSKPILMEFDGHVLNVNEDVKIGKPIHLIIADLHSFKNTPAILRDLRKAYPEPKTDIHRGVHRLLGTLNHEIMHQALEALEQGDAERIGQLMTKAQSYFDQYAMPASPQHLESPVLHKLLGNSRLSPYVFGGKGVGSQGDGSAQFVAKSEHDRAVAMRIITDELGMSCLPLTLGVSHD